MAGWHTIRGVCAEQLQPGLDVGVGRVKLRSPLVGVEGIVDLVVAAFVL